MPDRKLFSRDLRLGLGLAALSVTVGISGLAAGAGDASAPKSVASSRPANSDAGSPPKTTTASPGESGPPRDGIDPHSAGAMDVADPHGGADPHGSGNAAGGPKTPADTVSEDPALPKGTIDVEIRDENDRPRGQVPVLLGIVQNSVAKGENRQRLSASTSADGHVRWNNLEGGSQMAYRVSVTEGAAQFAARPFQLDPNKGTRVVLHTFPSTSDLATALVVMQSIVYVELKDDRVQVQQAFNIFNFGKMAWVPKDFVLPLPAGFTALTSSQQMSDQTVEAAEGRGAKVSGTFGPGQHSIEYRWQLPFGGEPNLDLGIGMPGNVAAARVMVVATSQMKVSVDGFPAMRAGRDGQGNNLLETEREMRRAEAPLRSVRIVLADIPGPGPLRLYAAGISTVGVLLGLSYASRSRKDHRGRETDRKKERERLLAELEELERAHRVGELGPRTYEKSRRELIDALARTLAADAATTSTKAL